MNLKKIFTEHPESLGESYFQHLYHAFCFGSQMVIGGVACIIHAIFPCWFKNTGSDFLLRLTNKFINRMKQCDERVIAIQKCIQQKSNPDGRSH